MDLAIWKSLLKSLIFLFGFSQAFYFIMKSVDEDGLYAKYHTTWVALFHMTLGEYEVGFSSV